jgi:hypothetical protein
VSVIPSQRPSLRHRATARSTCLTTSLARACGILKYGATDSSASIVASGSVSEEIHVLHGLPCRGLPQRPCRRTGSQNRCPPLAMSAMPEEPTPICAAVAGVITSKGHTNAAVFWPGSMAVCWDRSTE